MNEVDVTVACRFSLPGDAAVNPIDTASSKLRGTNKERFMVAATAKELCKRRYKSKIATASGKSVSETAHPKMFIYATLRETNVQKTCFSGRFHATPLEPITVPSTAFSVRTLLFCFLFVCLFFHLRIGFSIAIVVFLLNNAHDCIPVHELLIVEKFIHQEQYTFSRPTLIDRFFEFNWGKSLP